ncbi:MAG: hypothetical protein R2874_10530 [Desulfobacterales bacterium]
MVIAALIVGLLSALVSKVVLVPLQEVVAFTSKIAQGDYAGQLEIRKKMKLEN